MKRRSRILSGVGLAALLFAASAFGVARSRNDTTGSAGVLAAPGASSSLAHISGETLDQTIAGLQTRLKTLPTDYRSWSTLGIAYVQQAKVTVNSEYYPKAEGVLKKSLTINDTDNYLAYAGLASLANARHDFAAAKSFAQKGLALNSYSDILYGALSDSETQLGEYDAAFKDVQKMIDLSPDTSSLSRASYTWELRGNIDQATKLMQQAFDDAPNPATKAFALYYLGELAFNSGDTNAALTYYNQALADAPGDSASLEGKAKAEAALGQNLTAIDDYTKVVQQTPEPNYLIEFGELLESLGRTADAQQQYSVFATTQKLFEANGVQPDSDPTLFYANHGDPARALTSAVKGIGTRPFLVMDDAYAWALHVNGRDTEALTTVDKALATGMRNALFHYHKGMIEFALGDMATAKSELTEAMTINPKFNPLAAPIAIATLAKIGTAK
jgi:tetratricopeptide (TPR) repeat protein